MLLTDDAHRRCYEAGESVSAEVEHDSQLAQGGGHVRTNKSHSVTLITDKFRLELYCCTRSSTSGSSRSSSSCSSSSSSSSSKS